LYKPKRFFLELVAQRIVPKGAELTIRYTSVFEVSKKIRYFDAILTLL
jgi:hypothetical protein